MKWIDLLALLMLSVSWISINAVWGMTGPVTLVSGWLSDQGLLREALIYGPAVLMLISVAAGLLRNQKLMILGLMLLAYVLGVFLSRYMKETIDPSNIFVNRSLLLVPAIPMLIVAFSSKPRMTFLLAIGDWSQKCEIRLLRCKNWRKALVVTTMSLAIPAFILFQAGVEFKPIETGSIWAWMPRIVGLSILNGFSEELLFRGLMIIPLVALLGVRKGIWFQAIYFGFHHLGASPELIAGLPMAIILTFLGVLFGYGTWETKGLGWAIILHALLDIASLSAHLPI